MLGIKKEGKHFLGNKSGLKKALGMKDYIKDDVKKNSGVDMSSFIINSNDNQNQYEPIKGVNYKIKDNSANIERKMKHKHLSEKHFS